MTRVRTLRTIGILEGLSFLLLLFVAMPLKYAFDQPIYVRVLGMAHGGLFLAFLLVLGSTTKARGWSFDFAFKLLVAALVPFGFLFVDKSLKREMNSEPPGVTVA